MATIDGINRVTASVVELNGDQSIQVQLVYIGDKIEEGYNWQRVEITECK